MFWQRINHFTDVEWEFHVGRLRVAAGKRMAVRIPHLIWTCRDQHGLHHTSLIYYLQRSCVCYLFDSRTSRWTLYGGWDETAVKARNVAVGWVWLNNKFKKNETSSLKKSQNLSFVTFNLQRQKIITMWAICATSNTPAGLIREFLLLWRNWELKFICVKSIWNCSCNFICISVAILLDQPGFMQADAVLLIFWCVFARFIALISESWIQNHRIRTRSPLTAA